MSSKKTAPATAPAPVEEPAVEAEFPIEGTIRIERSGQWLRQLVPVRTGAAEVRLASRILGTATEVRALVRLGEVALLAKSAVVRAVASEQAQKHGNLLEVVRVNGAASTYAIEDLEKVLDAADAETASVRRRRG